MVLSEKNLHTIYDESFATRRYGDQETINTLLNLYKTEKNPVDFKEELLSIVQLYFDSLLPKAKDSLHSNPNNWQKEKEVLYCLCTEGIKIISQFYRGEDLDFDNAKSHVLSYREQILNSVDKSIRSKEPHLKAFDELSLIQDFGQKLSRKSHDKLVGIVSGGLEPSFLATDILEKGMDDLILLRYSKRSGDSQSLVPKNAPADYLGSIAGREVIVIEDYVVNGITMGAVVDAIKTYKPKNIDGIALSATKSAPHSSAFKNMDIDYSKSVMDEKYIHPFEFTVSQME